MTHFKEHKDLSKLTLSKNLKIPVIVHAVPNEKIFKKIIMDGKIKIPKKHKTKKRTPLMENVLNTNNCIYLSLNFDYNAQIFQWPYGFLFDLKSLKEFKFYKEFLIWTSFKKTIDFLDKHDKEFVLEMKQNKKLKQIIETYYSSDKTMFQFWKAEKEIFKYIMNSKWKTQIIKEINKNKKELFLKYPKSKKYAKKVYRVSEKNKEILSHKDILLRDHNFIGLYVKKGHLKKIKKTINELRKIKKSFFIYDGEKTIEIN